MATTAPVDVKELPHAYVFVMDVPGMTHNEIKVSVEDDSILKLSGERKRDNADSPDVNAKYVRVERPVGKFMRKFSLPSNAHLDNISASCHDGIITVVVPKLPPSEPRRPKTFDIHVTTSQPASSSHINNNGSN